MPCHRFWTTATVVYSFAVCPSSLFLPLMMLIHQLFRGGLPSRTTIVPRSLLSTCVSGRGSMLLKPAERDMAESDFQFRIKKEAGEDSEFT